MKSKYPFLVIIQEEFYDKNRSKIYYLINLENQNIITFDTKYSPIGWNIFGKSFAGLEKCINCLEQIKNYVFSYYDSDDDIPLQYIKFFERIEDEIKKYET